MLRNLSYFLVCTIWKLTPFEYSKWTQYLLAVPVREYWLDNYWRFLSWLGLIGDIQHQISDFKVWRLQLLHGPLSEFADMRQLCRLDYSDCNYNPGELALPQSYCGGKGLRLLPQASKSNVGWQILPSTCSSWHCCQAQLSGLNKGLARSSDLRSFSKPLRANSRRLFKRCGWLFLLDHFHHWYHLEQASIQHHILQESEESATECHRRLDSILPLGFRWSLCICHPARQHLGAVISIQREHR